MADTNIVQTGHTASRQSSNPFGKAIQGIAATIGLASETIYHHKKKRASQQFQRDTIPRSFSNGDCIPTTTDLDSFRSLNEAEAQARLPAQVDEVAWALDEVQDDISTNNGNTAPPDHSPLGSPMLADSFLQSHPSAKSPAAFGRIELPVVITQRRPKARTRGFIRAYAPILQDVGIDQETFVDFIDQLNKAVEPSPWISAIDLASLAGHAFPEPIHLLISASALMATQITAEVVSRSKSNAFLDKMNQDFFKPKGLIALVVTWKPKQDGSKQSTTGIVDIDMSAAAANKKTQEDSLASMKRRKSTIQMPSSGDMFELPEFAPLVFPKLEYVGPAVRQVKLGGKSAGTSVKRTGHFISDYQDRRAVARWSGQHPDSRMAKLAPAPGFQSRFADPNHPAGSGDFVALVTGGKRTTAEDILYLMIVNLPTEEEIADAAACLNQAKEENTTEDKLVENSFEPQN
ncbi:hypothetical protein F5883DRAFT_409957 [Diaporthe sp. PMI_573]|nr:hypothetical protein F5883DRAFT_409957 [Diaporthaceae sp. PMI_573]